MKNLVLITFLSITLTGCTTMVKQSQVTPGMNRETVTLKWGSPEKVENFANSCCKLPKEEAWFYFHTKGQPPMQPKYILFKNNRVESVYVWNK